MKKSERGGDRALAAYAWGFVAYLMVVILFGAWVRITHSGAGCGDHWPTCHGQIIPFEPSVETMIEFTHRVTSGLCGIFGLGLLVLAWDKTRGSRVFYGALLTLIFIVVEALIGAGIVLKELVADDDSVARAIVISLHLVNTLILMGAASLTAWWAGGAPALSRAQLRAPHALAGVALVLLVATSMSGAVTALGDTLFPVDATVGSGLWARVRDDLSTANHFLIRLRIMHPLIAVVTAAYCAWFLTARSDARRHDAGTRRWAMVALVGVGAQVLVGLLNVALAAPGWLQLVHLALAQVVWIGLVLTSASWLAEPRSA